MVDTDEVNTFACGGHLVVVTTFAVTELTASQLRGVLAHELSHHLGLHTVAITLGHWLSVPVVVLARIGFYLENVAQAAAGSFGQRSAAIAAVGTVAAAIFSGLAWVFTAAIRGSDAITNMVGHSSEYEADQLAVRMGFGAELAGALRFVLAQGYGARTDRVAGTTGHVAPAGTHTRRPHRSPDAPPRPLTSPNPALPRRSGRDRGHDGIEQADEVGRERPRCRGRACRR